jgi:chromosome segregation ATPase
MQGQSAELAHSRTTNFDLSEELRDSIRAAIQAETARQAAETRAKNSEAMVVRTTDIIKDSEESRKALEAALAAAKAAENEMRQRLNAHEQAANRCMLNSMVYHVAQ